MTGRNIVCVGGTRHNIVATGRKGPCVVKINWILHAKENNGYFTFENLLKKAGFEKKRLSMFVIHEKSNDRKRLQL